MLISKILNHLEDFKPRLKLKIRWALLILLLLSFRLIVNADEAIRDFLPLPYQLNPFYHTGNLSSTIPAALSCYLVGFLLARFITNNPKKIKLMAVVVGTFIGLLANIYVENSSGMLSLGLPNSGDIFDVIWGTLFCLLTNLVIFKVKGDEGDEHST